MSPGRDGSELASFLSGRPYRRKLRYLYDRLAGVLIAVGGIGVVIAILLIFVYLLYEVIPLFQSADVQQLDEYTLVQTQSADLLHLAVEEQSQIGMRLGDDARAVFFSVADGSLIDAVQINLPAGDLITSFAIDSEESGLFTFGLSSGKALIAQYDFETTYDTSGLRKIEPIISFPYGEEAFDLLSGSAVDQIAVNVRSDVLILAGVDSSGNTNLLRITQQRNLFSSFNFGGGQADFDVEQVSISTQIPNVDKLFIDGDQRWLYFVSARGRLSLVELRPALNGENTSVAEEIDLLEPGRSPTQISFLLGGISLLVADDGGTVSQWFLGTDDGRVTLQKVRAFNSSPAPIVAVSPEQRRKNFITVDAEGYIGIYNTTAQRRVFYEQLLDVAPRAIAIAPRGDTLLAEFADGRISVWDVYNEHPEVSFSALWGKVWYENYSEPDYIWQSSAASNDFEPKYSLVPLAFGTLKAAFYAMLLAAPLAICGAIFTGYFMVPVMRQQVKPLIELMEAMPTVVLGFLAGLWLAPFIENNLLGIFSLLFVMPLGILLASFLWVQLPENIRHTVPDGWESALLIPVVIAAIYFAFGFSSILEGMFFGGDMRSWVTNDLGIAYDQRNALVVGLAMGFAVIPTIFSIAEDAIFNVPRHLSYGSLALGATPWQTMYRVVLPTASPGIFSGVMIGFGRAVGETMIVLMATGNTPIMDMNIFEGMRTLAANIAVEVPESEVASTHYRILFLAALALFMFTFVFNTLAEIVRQRLRNKYSTI
ncbi:MAG: ABC transporter permease subunit [Gammaproteobacteria bacterium]|nr:ABC transporter permease subunit [Gammaproteobacteria bacterium]